AGAADAVDDRRPAVAAERKFFRLRHAVQRIGRAGRAAGLADLRAVHRHEGGAETVDAGKILVAGGLVDAPLAAELGLDRLDRDAVGLDAAVAAALADQFVDEDAPVGVREGAALAAAALFRRAG